MAEKKEEKKETTISFLKPIPQSFFKFSEKVVLLRNNTVRPFQLSDLVDRPTILNFFITHCGPCRQEFPSLQRLKAILGNDWRIVAVNVGAKKEEVVHYFKFEVDWMGDVILDLEKRLAKKFAVCAFPTTYLISKEGQIGFFIENNLICHA